MSGTTFADFVADNIPVMCWMASADGGIHWYNQAWYDYTGSTPERMDGWGWQDCLNPEFRSQVSVRWTAALRAGVPFEMVLPLKAKDGTYRAFLTRVSPTLRGGKIISWFGSNTDISDLIEESPALQAKLDALRTGR